MRDPANPSASVHRKRFFTPSLTLKFLCAGYLNPGYLKERFIADYNARFAVPAAEPGSAFTPYVGRPIEDVLCVQEDRVVGADNCVSYNRRSLQVPRQRHRQHYVRATVRVHEYPDGSLAIFDGPRCLVRFDPKGRGSDLVSRAA